MTTERGIKRVLTAVSGFLAVAFLAVSGTNPFGYLATNSVCHRYDCYLVHTWQWYANGAGEAFLLFLIPCAWAAFFAGRWVVRGFLPSSVPPSPPPLAIKPKQSELAGEPAPTGSYYDTVSRTSRED